MKKLFLLTAILLLPCMDALAVSKPSDCPAGTTPVKTIPGGRGGGYRVVYNCVPNGCTTPWGISVPSGTTFNAYQSDLVTYPDVCVSESVTCTNGALSPNLGYSYQSCSVALPPTTGGGSGTGTGTGSGTGGHHHQHHGGNSGNTGTGG